MDAKYVVVASNVRTGERQERAEASDYDTARAEGDVIRRILDADVDDWDVHLLERAEDGGERVIEL